MPSIVWHGELADVVTRGDANEVGENWSVSASDRVGEVVLRIPRAGYAVGVLATPAGQLALAGLAVALESVDPRGALAPPTGQ